MPVAPPSWGMGHGSAAGLPTAPGIWGSGNAANLLATNAAPVPIVWGTGKVNNVLLGYLNSWNPVASPYDAWQPATTYYQGNRVQANGNVYECVLPYLFGTAAYGLGTWAQNTSYQQGAIITNNGNVYGCVVAGLSKNSGTGPSGTSAFQWDLTGVGSVRAA